MPQHSSHSEELQEIMGRIPSRVVRWGTGVIFVILAIILLLSWVVKYPEMVSAPITITTLNPPADLMARSTGKIQRLFVATVSRWRRAIWLRCSTTWPIATTFLRS